MGTAHRCPNEPMMLAIVEDDDDVRLALSRLLRAMGHQVKLFTSAEDFEAHGAGVDCAVVDVRLPGLSGLDLRERQRDRIPSIPIVLMTGCCDRISGDVAADTPVILKPLDDAVLMAAIGVAISAQAAARGRHAR